MARKKELIEADFVKTETALDSAQKTCKTTTATSADLKIFKSHFDTWETLLAEAETKINAWKNETDAKRLAWAKTVNTRSTRLRKGYAAQLKACGEAIASREEAARLHELAAKALAELISQLKVQVAPKLDEAEKHLKNARIALTKNDPVAAVAAHGSLLNALKNASGSVSKGGAKKNVKSAASVRKIKEGDIDTDDADYKKQLKLQQARFQVLQKDADALDDAIEQLDDELANRDPDSPNNDPQYQRHLKEVVKDYADVLKFATTTLGTLKAQEKNTAKLEAVAAKTVTPETVKPVVVMALKLAKTIRDGYASVDGHIQKTIRTSDSSVKKKAEAYGITTPDVLTNLKPLMDRAFAANFRCKAIAEAVDDRLQEVLEGLARKFNSAEARAAAALLDR